MKFKAAEYKAPKRKPGFLGWFMKNSVDIAGEQAAGLAMILEIKSKVRKEVKECDAAMKRMEAETRKLELMMLANDALELE